MITGIVPDDAFAASSNFDEQSAPKRGRAQIKPMGSFLGRALFDVMTNVLKVEVEVIPLPPPPPLHLKNEDSNHNSLKPPVIL